MTVCHCLLYDMFIYGIILFLLGHTRKWISMRWVWLTLAFALVWLVGYLQLTLWFIVVLHPLLLWVLVRLMRSPSHTPLQQPVPIKPLLPTESCHWLNSLIKQWLVIISYLLLWSPIARGLYYKTFVILPFEMVY